MILECVGLSELQRSEIIVNKTVVLNLGSGYPHVGTKCCPRGNKHRALSHTNCLANVVIKQKLLFFQAMGKYP